jgi:signal transduction histidine kinase
VAVQFQGDEASGALRGERALGLFRVAQEALRNAVVHARPKHIRVELRAESEGTRVSVSDDGCGFDTDAGRERASLGLASMRERVALLGGSFELRSRPGQGTQVTVWAPS